MARQKNQAQRRSELVEATARAIAAKGLAGMFMKDVAEQAGISERLVSYYYKNLDELVAEAHRAAVDRYYWGRLQAIEAASSPVDALDRLMSSGLPDGPGDVLSRVLYEASVNAGRRPEHAQLMSKLFDLETSLYEKVLGSGIEAAVFSLNGPVASVARTFVALEDAFGLHVLALTRALDLAEARSLLRSYAFTATGCAAFDPASGAG